MDSLQCEDVSNFNVFDLVKKQRYDSLEMVLENLHIYNFAVDSKDEDENTLLHLIISKDKCDLGKALINLSSSVNITNKMKETPLHLACAAGNTNAVKLLMKNGALMNMKDKDGENAIFKAARNGHLTVIQLLQAPPEYLTDINDNHENLLHAAVVAGNTHIIDYLLKSTCIDINAPTAGGSTSLHLALNLTNNLTVMMTLLDAGADLHVKDNKSRTLLHLSVTGNKLELCRLLIDRGSSVNARDDNGATPLHYAVDLQLKKIIFLLVFNKADVNQQDSDGYTPLHEAARTSDVLVKFLLRHKALHHVKTANGDSPLHIAASFGKLKAAMVLLSRGFRTDVFNNDHHTPAQLAEINGHRMVRKLLSKKK